MRLLSLFTCVNEPKKTNTANNRKAVDIPKEDSAASPKNCYLE